MESNLTELQFKHVIAVMEQQVQTYLVDARNAINNDDRLHLFRKIDAADLLINDLFILQQKVK